MIELEDLIGSKPPITPMIMMGGFSPDNRVFTYLKAKVDRSQVMDLWAFNLEDKTHSCLVDSSFLSAPSMDLSDEEKARQERLRSFVTGISGYQWAPQADKLLFSSNGGLYLFEAGKGIQCVVEKGSMDGKFSPNGRYISFVSSRNLWVVDLRDNTSSLKPKQVTTWGGGDLHCGSAEFVVEEEFQRYEGYFWSTNEQYLAFEEYDETPVAVMKRHEIYADHTEIIEQRYPKAGEANVDWRIGIANMENGTHEYISMDTRNQYLARAAWHGGIFYFLVVNRQQSNSQLYSYDASTKKVSLVYEESSPHWINVMDRLHFTPKGDVVFLSERSGFASAYVYSHLGKLMHSIEFIEESVIKICRVFDEEIDLEVAIDQGMSHVVRRVNLKTGKITFDATPKGEVSTGVSSSDGNWIACTRTSTFSPQLVELIHVPTQERTMVHQSKILDHIANEMAKAEFGSISTAEGELNYRLILPQNFVSTNQYPAVVHVYGGPHAQRVNYGWIGWQGFFAHFLASQGFVVFTLDNRGSANRGKGFETAIYRALGSVEVEDQVTGVKYLQSLSFVDSARIGIYGWSYGGYMTLMCLMKHSDLFQAGSSGAPVTDWTLYDTAYTERYMGTPAENAEGYRKSSVFSWIDGLKGPLQLVHGMADDNVLYVNSTKLYSALQNAGKLFEIQAYPGEKHALANPKMRVHCHQSITKFFKENL